MTVLPFNIHSYIFREPGTFLLLQHDAPAVISTESGVGIGATRTGTNQHRWHHNCLLEYMARHGRCVCCHVQDLTLQIDQPRIDALETTLTLRRQAYVRHIHAKVLLSKYDVVDMLNWRSMSMRFGSHEA